MAMLTIACSLFVIVAGLISPSGYDHPQYAMTGETQQQTLRLGVVREAGAGVIV